MGSYHTHITHQRHTMKFILAVALILCFSCALCNAAECQDSDFIGNVNLCASANTALEISLNSCENFSGKDKTNCRDVAFQACEASANLAGTTGKCDCSSDTCNSTNTIAASLLVMLLAKLF